MNPCDKQASKKATYLIKGKSIKFYKKITWTTTPYKFSYKTKEKKKKI
jgi:hypothetical protein